MNILITGASRGIGAAALAALQRDGHRVIGHSSQGSDLLITGDLSDPAAPRDIWDTAADERETGSHSSPASRNWRTEAVGKTHR